MAKHSVIIPNRGYDRWLEFCLWSLHRSLRYCGLSLADLEVLVVADAPTESPEIGNVREVEPHGRYFNKPRLLNIGIENTSGEVLTFLDADAIVGPRFLESAPWLLHPDYAHLTKLCYRVRKLPLASLSLLESMTDPEEREATVTKWFAKANRYPVAAECYGTAEPWNAKKGPRPDKPVFGNSQFSIRREVLGDLRFDEAYEGRGFEDCEMNRRIARHYGDAYQAVVVTDPDHNMFHVGNPSQGELWGPGEQNTRNMQRYFST